jgi:hypothetical protein
MRLIILFISLFSFNWALSQDLTQLTKKEQKFAYRIFEGEPGAEALIIPDRDTAYEGFSMDGDRLYLMKQQDVGIGYLLSTMAKGRFDYFDYIVAYAPDLSVLGLSILVYRSDHGAAICQKGWLGQFEGYTGEDLKLGKEIDAVAGATISATSMVKDMKRTHQLMISLKEEGIIQ